MFGGKYGAPTFYDEVKLGDLRAPCSQHTIYPLSDLGRLSPVSNGVTEFPERKPP